VTNCAWWIAAVIRLDQGLVIYIDNQLSWEAITREVSSTPRDIARDVSPEEITQDNQQEPGYDTDPRKRIRQGMITPLSPIKRQHMKARKW
jgi:hypothetical protein